MVRKQSKKMRFWIIAQIFFGILFSILQGCGVKKSPDAYYPHAMQFDDGTPTPTPTPTRTQTPSPSPTPGSRRHAH
jgi:hypothetical protein